MNSMLIGFFSFLISFPSMASSFSGFVNVLEKNKLIITLTNSGKKLPLNPVNSEIQSQMSKLKTGDFLSLEGFTNDDKTLLYISSVNYVGLKDLIGNWTGDDEYCYKFKDFYVLSIYNKNEKWKCDFSLTYLAREFSYFINPSVEGWSVLLSDDEDSYLMDLTLNLKNSAELSLYDSKSGDILRQIKIKR